jgi:P63C domain
MHKADERDPHETGRQGGLARAERLPPEARSEIARRAAQKRWGTTMLRAEHAGDLKIGTLTLACAVIDDGTKATRVINQSTMLTALGRSSRPKGGDAGTVLFAANLQPYISGDLAETLRKPITYITPGGKRALGYPAEILPEICEVYLRAKEADPSPLRDSQKAAAVAAGVLVRGLARTGIIALVDEVTGYQDVRAKDALAKILEAYVDKELQPWVRTFPADFYRELFRLRGLEYPKSEVKRPRYFGTITNDIVYRRLAPGVLAELKRVQVRDDEGRPKHKLFQRLTTNTGYPKLREHLGSVVTLMKLSTDWNDFRNKIERIHPRFGDTMVLPFDQEEHDDSGTGL